MEHPPTQTDLAATIERSAMGRDDVGQALSLLLQAAAEGDPDGTFHAGRLLFDLERFDEAIPRLREAAEQGQVRAEVWLAKAMENGHGVARDLDAAIAIYRRYEEDEPEAAIRLAGCYASGEGVERDLDRARETYGRLAERDCPQGWYGLGWLRHLEGQDRDNWLEHSLELFERAAEGGLAVACELCGEYYADPGHPAYDFDKAVRYLRRAAAFDFPSATAHLAGMYLRGWGVDKDPNEARPLLLRAIERGDGYAMFLMALTYEFGHGVPKDLDAATHWLRRSSAADCGLATRRLREHRFPPLRWWREARKATARLGRSIRGRL